MSSVTYRKRVFKKCPEGYSCWPAYWYDRIAAGTPIKELERHGYAVSDIRYFTRIWARMNDREILPAIQQIKVSA